MRQSDMCRYTELAEAIGLGTLETVKVDKCRPPAINSAFMQEHKIQQRKKKIRKSLKKAGFPVKNNEI
jgi:hypothetical protein